MRPDELFSLARLRVSIIWPALASAVWALRPAQPVANLLLLCGGAVATDTRWRVYYDPEAIASFTVGQAATALVHEAWHCLRLHGPRANALHVEPRWLAALAAALDAEINGDMERCTPAPDWPYEIFTPKDFDLPPGLPFADYYPAAQRVVGPEEPCCCCCLGGSSMGGGPRAWEQPGAAGGVDALEAEGIRRDVAQAIQRGGYGRGCYPAELFRWAEGVLAPARVPWQRLLAQTIRGSLSFASGAVDYTRQVPNRRQAVTPVLLPTLRRPRVTVDVVIDTSGSMGTAELHEALAETEGVLKATGAGVRLYAVDAAVHGGVQHVRRAADVKLLGGGGTDMGAGIAFAERQRPRADVLIMATDGATPWPAQRPRIARVIVCLVGRHHAAAKAAVPPWAQVVEVSP